MDFQPAASDRWRALLSSRAAHALALAGACRPVLRWYVARMNDGSDEPWGLAALAAAAFFCPRKGWNEPLPKSNRLVLCGLLAVYALSYRFLPPIGHALGFVTLAALAAPRQSSSFAW